MINQELSEIASLLESVKKRLEQQEQTYRNAGKIWGADNLKECANLASKAAWWVNWQIGREYLENEDEQTKKTLQEGKEK